MIKTAELPELGNAGYEKAQLHHSNAKHDSDFRSIDPH
jgi:hypothetical protein